MAEEEPRDESAFHQELSTDFHDPLIRVLHVAIRLCIKMLAILHLTVSEIFEVFGAFMVVLIAVEIFINIRLYLGSNTLPIQLVVATALMAIAHKVIVLDITETPADYVFAIGLVTLALGVTYWLVSGSAATTIRSKKKGEPEAQSSPAQAPD